MPGWHWTVCQSMRGRPLCPCTRSLSLCWFRNAVTLRLHHVSRSASDILSQHKRLTSRSMRLISLSRVASWVFQSRSWHRRCHSPYTRRTNPCLIIISHCNMQLSKTNRFSHTNHCHAYLSVSRRCQLTEPYAACCKQYCSTLQ